MDLFLRWILKYVRSEAKHEQEVQKGRLLTIVESDSMAHFTQATYALYIESFACEGMHLLISTPPSTTHSQSAY